MFTEDNAKRKRASKWIIGMVAVCCLICLCMRHISSVAGAAAYLFRMLSPLFYGFMLAMVLNAPMRFFERILFPKSTRPKIHRVRRMLAIVLALVCIIGIIVGVAFLVLPELVEAVTIVVQKIGGVLDQLAQMDANADWSSFPLGEYIAQIDINWSDLKNSLNEWIKTQGTAILNGAANIFSIAFSSIVDLVLSLIFALYILSGKEKLKGQFCRLIRAWLPEKPGAYFIHAASVASETFRQFIVGQTMEAVILGLLCSTGMLILCLPYAPTIGALVGVLALIPIMGAYAAAFIGAFMILTVEPFKAVVFLIFLVILQQLEGNLIYPRVVGGKIRLPAIWVLAAITFGGSIAGPIGMLLGVPAASTIYALLKEATLHREFSLK